MEGFGKVIGQKAPDFKLQSQSGDMVVLSEALKISPVLLAFYPGDFTMVCTKQLCNYRDNIDEFKKFPVQVLAISSDPLEKHQDFNQKHSFPFPLLSDPNHAVAKMFNCTSLLMFGNVSRAIFIINQKGLILYRYIEPTTLTSRKADELIQILSDLRKHALI